MEKFSVINFQSNLCNKFTKPWIKFKLSLSHSIQNNLNNTSGYLYNFKSFGLHWKLKTNPNSEFSQEGEGLLFHFISCERCVYFICDCFFFSRPSGDTLLQLERFIHARACKWVSFDIVIGKYEFYSDRWKWIALRCPRFSLIVSAESKRVILYSQVEHGKGLYFHLCLCRPPVLKPESGNKLHKKILIIRGLPM